MKQNILKKFISYALLFAMLISFLPQISTSATDFPVVTQDFNGHTYAVFDIGMTWHDAKAYCESLGGHLATITSQEEQAFIEKLINNRNKNLYWLGGTDEDIEGEWKWITGEEWNYTNWDIDAPCDGTFWGDDGEDYLAITSITQDSYPSALYSWEDISKNVPADAWEGVDNLGFICEWEYIKDFAVSTQNFAGYTYTVFDISMTWHDAKAYCENLGGHLTTITSQEEQDFIESLIENGTKNQYWLGANDELHNRDWQWVTGEKWDYTNDSVAEINNYRDVEYYLQMYRLPNPVTGVGFGNWNDITYDNYIPGEEDFFTTNQIGFICEWDYIYSPRENAKSKGASEWAQADIDRARGLGLLPDSLDGNYQQNIKRAEFCELAVRLYEKINGVMPPPPMIFDDIENLSTSKKLAINKMASIGVVNGVGIKLFKPNNEITRQEAATMLVRLLEALDYVITPKTATFADINEAADWACDYIGKVQYLNIMSGVGDNKFDPLGNYTREQSIVTLMRIWDLALPNDSTDIIAGGETKAVLIQRPWGSTIQLYLDKYWTDEINNALDRTGGNLLTLNEINAIDTLISALPKLAGIVSSEYLLYAVIAIEFSKLIIKNNDKSNGVIIELHIINPGLIPSLQGTPLQWVWVKPQ